MIGVLYFHYLPRIKNESTKNRLAPTVYTPSFSQSGTSQSGTSQSGTETKKEIPWVLDSWWDRKNFYYKYSWRQAEILNWNPQNSQLKIHFTGWKQESDIILYLDRQDDRKRFISDSTLLNEIQLNKSGPSLYRQMPNGELRLSGPIYNTLSNEYINGDIFLVRVK